MTNIFKTIVLLAALFIVAAGCKTEKNNQVEVLNARKTDDASGKSDCAIFQGEYRRVFGTDVAVRTKLMLRRIRFGINDMSEKEIIAALEEVTKSSENVKDYYTKYSILSEISQFYISGLGDVEAAKNTILMIPSKSLRIQAMHDLLSQEKIWKSVKKSLTPKFFENVDDDLKDSAPQDELYAEFAKQLLNWGQCEVAVDVAKRVLAESLRSNLVTLFSVNDCKLGYGDSLRELCAVSDFWKAPQAHIDDALIQQIPPEVEHALKQLLEECGPAERHWLCQWLAMRTDCGTDMSKCRHKNNLLVNDYANLSELEEETRIYQNMEDSSNAHLLRLLNKEEFSAANSDSKNIGIVLLAIRKLKTSDSAAAMLMTMEDIYCHSENVVKK